MPELIPAGPGTPEWLAARRLGVTATDIVTILGLSSTDSAYSLFWRKMGQVPEMEDSDRFRLGRELEPYVLSRWVDQHDQLLTESALYRHSERSWQLATIDAATLIGGEPVEVKSWADADRRSWGGEYVPYAGRIDDDGTHLDPEPVQPPAGNQIPPRVRAQVLWQMDVMGMAVGHVGVVFLPSGEFRSYVIEHQRPPCDGFIGQVNLCSACQDIGLMRAAGEEFMRRLRLELPPPDPDSSAATLAAVRARFTRQPDKTAEVDGDDWADFQRADDEIHRWTIAKRAVELDLRTQAEEASVYTVDGQPVARRIITDAHVQAHVRHQDYIRRIKQGDESDG